MSMDDTGSQGVTEEEPSSHDQGSVGSGKAEDDFESQALEDSKSTTKVPKRPRKTATDSCLSQRRRGEPAARTPWAPKISRRSRKKASNKDT